jgi:hypothetical protein
LWRVWRRNESRRIAKSQAAFGGIEPTMRSLPDRATVATVFQNKGRNRTMADITNKEFIHASAKDFSKGLQQLLEEEREIYRALKAKKAEVLERVREEMTLEFGREVAGTGYTRWGQWVIVIGDRPAPKTAKHRTYSEYRTELEADLHTTRRGHL